MRFTGNVRATFVPDSTTAAVWYDDVSDQTVLVVKVGHLGGARELARRHVFDEHGLRPVSCTLVRDKVAVLRPDPEGN